MTGKLAIRTVAALMLFWPQIGMAEAGPRDITVVLPEPLETVEPCQSALSTVGRVIKQNVAETLTELDPDNGDVLPRLALSWERLTPATWRFKLREGVKFHDGADFDANAVGYAINRTMDKNLLCMNRNKYFGSMALSTKPVDAHTVDITADPPQAILPTILSNMTIVSPNTPMGEAARQPAGTGPYVFKSWDPGQNIVLERFPGYWGTKPDVERATYVWRPDSAVAAAMVTTGEADIAPSIAVQDATNPATDFSYLNSETTRIRIGSDVPPLNDLRVREALNLAVNRSAFVGSILSKDVQPAAQLVVSSIAGYNPDLKPWPFDLAKAKQLLAAAKADGVPIDREIRLVGRNAIFPNVDETLEALTQMWGDAGLNVKLQMFEVAQALKLGTKPYAPDRPPSLVVDQHDNNAGDASFTLIYKYSSTGAQSDVNDPELDHLIQGGAQQIGDARKQLFQKAFARIAQNLVPDVMLFHMVGYTRVGPRLVFHPTIATNSELQLAQIKFKQ